MPDICRFCGEKAVVEAQVEDGRDDQRVCMECGTIAGEISQQRQSDFEVEGGTFVTAKDNFGNPEVTEKNLSITKNCEETFEDPCCSSCGEPFDEACVMNTELCADCAAAEDECNESEHPTKSDCGGVTISVDLNSSIKQGILPKSEPDCQKCTSCQSVNLTYDSIGGDERLICLDCGTVNSESILSADTITNEGRCSSKYYTVSKPRYGSSSFQKPQGLLAGLNQISEIATHLSLNPSVVNDAEEMYKSVYYEPAVIRTTVDRKKYIALVCVFIVCRQRDMPIFLTHFKPHIPFYNKFLFAKKMLTKKLNLTCPSLSIINCLDSMLDKLDFVDYSFMCKVKDIIHLFQQAWLVDGYSRESLIAIAIYYAYISSDKCTKYIDGGQFFKAFNIQPPGSMIFAYCKKLMKKLALALPWNISKRTVSPCQISVYVNDILKYQQGLFHLTFNSEYNRNLSRSSRKLNTYNKNDDDDKNTQSGVKRPLTSSDVVFHWKDSLYPKRKNNFKEEKEFICPPNVNLDSSIIHENEFDNAEIDSYILSAEEQENLKKAKLEIMG